MDHIRKTMMQHDALFKEQVEALHRLYNIQKASMQEIRRRNYSRAHVFAFSPESLVLVEGQFCGSVLEGKPLRPPVFTGGRAHNQDALGLSLSPFCTLKEIRGSGSLWIDGMGAEPFVPAPSKPVRNFDLEKLPEDDADESTDLDGIAEEWKGSNLPDSTGSFQDLGSSGKVASTGPESEPYSSQVDMDLFPKDPITCSQDSSILESQYCESKELDEFIIQRSIHLETNSNPERQNLNLPAAAKDSSNGGNSIESQDTKFSKKNDTCEEDQASPSNKEVFLSEYEEAPLINQDVWRPSVSSTSTDSEIKPEQASASNMEHDESSSANKNIVGSDSDIDCKDINNACTRNTERDDKLSASSKGKDIAITSSISNPELKIEMTSKILAQLNDKMKELSSKQNRDHCCIYRVPKSLRNVNWKAYTPLLISVGPLHREIKRIQTMQNHKWRCFKEFTEQDGMNKEKIRDLVVIIQNKEKYIRFCYSEKFNQINSCDFIEMILLDAVFIIEFLKEYKHPKNFEPRMMFDIKEDLILLENQLPFSIIWGIYSEINCDFQDVHATWISFLDLVTDAFGKNTGGSFLNRVTYSQNEQSVNGSKHFTDLVRHFMLKGSIERSYSFDPVKLKYSAVMLRKAGVTFQVTRDSCLVNITFDKGVLKIPQLEVDHNFERLVRNIMAMEQCLYEREAYICSYIKFMDQLVDSAGDVGLLVQKDIILSRILHWLGDDAAVSNMINNFCENIGDNYTCFGDISQELNAHYENHWNHRKATLKLVYFPNIWRGTATVAAAILLILTFIQTISSVKSFY